MASSVYTLKQHCLFKSFTVYDEEWGEASALCKMVPLNDIMLSQSAASAELPPLLLLSRMSMFLLLMIRVASGADAAVGSQSPGHAYIMVGTVCLISACTLVFCCFSVIMGDDTLLAHWL